MKIPEGHLVCRLCREIIPVQDSKPFVASYEWGSFSGTPNYQQCCKTHPLNEQKEPTGQYTRIYV